MKKILAICLMMLLVMNMSVAAFAAPGSFVISPSGRPAPGVVTFEPKDDGCIAVLVVTPYVDKDKLPDALKDQLEKAYNDILAADDLKNLCDDLADAAGKKNLKVSDLFNIHTTDCDAHDSHKDFDVVLEADSLKNFVGLMYRDSNGKWIMVKDAKVSGNHLKFSLEGFQGSAPFAIVVGTGTNAPQTGDIGSIYPYLIVMAVSALALIALVVIYRKKVD